MDENNSRTAMKNPKTITLKVTEHQWAIGRALALMSTADNEPDETPFTAESLLDYGFIEGMIFLEKKVLGTNSLDHSVREGEPEYQNVTPLMGDLAEEVGLPCGEDGMLHAVPSFWERVAATNENMVDHHREDDSVAAGIAKEKMPSVALKPPKQELIETAPDVDKPSPCCRAPSSIRTVFSETMILVCSACQAFWDRPLKPAVRS